MKLRFITTSIILFLIATPVEAFFTLINDDPQPIASLATHERVIKANNTEQSNFNAFEVKVRKGDTLATIFKRAHLSINDMYTLLRDQKSKQKLANLHINRSLRFKQGPEHHLLELWYPLSDQESFHIYRDDMGYHSETTLYAKTQQLAYASATIQHSLFSAGAKAGIPDKVITQLTDLFNWEIDFAHDLRPGDNFSVLYKLTYLSNNKIIVDDVVAAEFNVKGQSHKAVLFIDPNGHKEYFTPEGKSLKRAFIRTPVKYTRISDPFNLRRFHPILHKVRPHKGVDYAAPHGTPIKATGNGVITFLGRKGGYGNAIVIKHNWRYTTLYGHLARFAKGLHNGSHVTQNQVIGYVGSTGLATGPHLHYEFRINGVHRNPMRVKLPQAQPILKRYRTYFLAHAQQFITLMHNYANQSTSIS